MPARIREGGLAALITALALAACTSTRGALIAQGFSPAYAEGYDDGCTSGKAAAGSTFHSARKDAGRYAADSQYGQGWDAGFARCERDMAAMVLDARRRRPGNDGQSRRRPVVRRARGGTGGHRSRGCTARPGPGVRPRPVRVAAGQTPWTGC
jgi:hypothetical protein